MNEKTKLAIELAKAFIQNPNVEPVEDSSDILKFKFDGTTFSFEEFVSYFYGEIKGIYERY